MNRITGQKRGDKTMNTTRTLTALAATLAAGAILAACGTQPAHRQATAATSAAPAAATSAAPTPAPVPSPNGTYQGSCDYTLAADPSANDHLIGEVDLTNTGNVGTVVRVRITWPQEGYPPVTARKTVRTLPGQTIPVRFHVSAGSIAGGSNVIDLLQSWQESHGLKDGCTYHATILRTFGSPQ